MKVLMALLLIVTPLTDLDKIARVNKAKKEAKEAYQAGNYQKARDTYQYLIDSLGVNEEAVLLDYAHSLYHVKDTANAVSQYQFLADSASARLASVAEQQLGQILFEKKQHKAALQHYKNALRKNPANQDARYNYELLKKIIQKEEQQKKDQQNNKNQDNKNKEQKEQQKKDKQDQKEGQQKKEDQKQKEEDQKKKEDKNKKEEDKKEGQEQEDQKKEDKKNDKKEEDKKDKQEEKDAQEKEGKKEETQEKEKQPQPSPSDKLKQLNISEEKARMILEAMKNNEIQYIQQNRRKATKKKQSGKPDW